MRTKGWIPVLVVVAMLAMASIALARGAPQDTNDRAIVSVAVAPDVVPVPQTTGFDVIQNVAAYSRLASVNQLSDTSGATGLSTTGDERGNVSGFNSNRSRSAPRIVLLA